MLPWRLPGHAGGPEPVEWTGVSRLPLDLAFWVAEVVGVHSLLLAGYLVARRVGLSRFLSLISGLAIGAVGGLIILLKILTG